MSFSEPIPGGCNIEFELENSPFINARRFERFTTFDDYALDFQPGSPSPKSKFDYKSFKCNLHVTGERLRYRLYAAYHDNYEHESDKQSEDNYFRQIMFMSHIDWIKQNARLVSISSLNLQLFYSFLNLVLFLFLILDCRNASRIINRTCLYSNSKL